MNLITQIQKKMHLITTGTVQIYTIENKTKKHILSNDISDTSWKTVIVAARKPHKPESA